MDSRHGRGSPRYRNVERRQPVQLVTVVAGHDPEGEEPFTAAEPGIVRIA